MASTAITTRNALVCGGSAGIGLAAARKLRDAGVSVRVLSRSGSSEFPSWSLDLSYLDDLQATLAETPGEYDILVNNAGGPPPGPIVTATVDQFLLAFRQQLLSAHLLTQWVLPYMQSRQYGRIINVISTSVREPIAGLGVSNTIRSAVAAWAKTLSREVAPHGITVNNVLPGATRTARLDSIIARKALEQPREAVEAEMLAEIPVGRFGQPEEIGAVIAFLASPAAAYITGVSIPVDGGRLHCV